MGWDIKKSLWIVAIGTIIMAATMGIFVALGILALMVVLFLLLA